MKLTNENIRKAKPGDVLRDGAISGLHLRAEFERYLDVSDGVEVFDGYARSTGTDVDVITVGLRYSF